jgi:hypothetical protein
MIRKSRTAQRGFKPPFGLVFAIGLIANHSRNIFDFVGRASPSSRRDGPTTTLRGMWCQRYIPPREKGKQGIPRTVARVLKALLGLALQYGEVRPSLLGIARLACACKQTVVNCLKLLSLYGFVIVHRRIRRIRTPLGFKVVQDTNAYTIQEPQGLGAIALRMFRQTSESRKWSPSSKDFPPNKGTGQKAGQRGIPDGVYTHLYEARPTV